MIRYNISLAWFLCKNSCSVRFKNKSKSSINKFNSGVGEAKICLPSFLALSNQELIVLVNSLYSSQLISRPNNSDINLSLCKYTWIVLVGIFVLILISLIDLEVGKYFNMVDNVNGIYEKFDEKFDALGAIDKWITFYNNVKS